MNDALPNPFVDALKEEAKEAGLRYTHDDQPGLQREKRGDVFVYLHTDGTPVEDDSTLTRFKRLAIPPAWTDVWICPRENGHIQATGRDARQRKQYRYHPKWREHRDENKFGRMIAFARVLPKIRRRVKRDLARRAMPREKVLATVVSLLEGTLIRVGNDEYVRQNGSYGLTTMRNRHVRVRGSKIEFAFKGKSGVRHEIAVQDRRLAQIVRRCQEMPGQDLFEYAGEDGQPHTITSQDVNEYLRAIAGEEFSAKDFRTWAGTVLAAIALREFEVFTAQTEARKNVVIAIEAVAKMLGNTPTVCRKCYVHPVILDSYLTGDTIATVQQQMAGKIDRSPSKLKPEEAAVLVLLQQKLKTSKRTVKARS